jgi:hypothetical protein
MLGLRFVKVLPTTHLMAYRGGRLVREGAGLSLLAYAPTTSLVAVPIASRDAPFIFEQVTRDFQTVTVQGQVAYRVADPHKLAAMLNFALAADGRSYASDDPQKLPQRVLGAVEVLVQQAVRAASLAEDPARALEAEAREAILKRADEAIFQRRTFAIERERAIRESELDTEVAVEQKKRLIRETQMEAEASVQRQRHALRGADMEADIALEDRRKALVAGNAENARVAAEAEAYRIAAVMKALEAADPRIVQALAAIGMNPGQLIAQAFGGIAEKAERIGQLNVSPELLQALMPRPETRAAR